MMQNTKEQCINTIKLCLEKTLNIKNMKNTRKRKVNSSKINLLGIKGT